MIIAIAYFTENGMKTADKIKEILEKRGCGCYVRNRDENLKEWTKEAFEKADAIVFVSATGIAVRTIAPLLKSKTTDPAVIVTDDRGKFVISLVSGHIGGANDMAESIAREMGSIPVITTATDINGKFAVDKWAKDNGLIIQNIAVAKDISMAVLEGKSVGITGKMPIVTEVCEVVKDDKLPLGINISWCDDKVYQRELKLIPKWLTLGIGCRKDTPVCKIEEAVQKVLKENNILETAISKVVSIDLKKDEKGLMEFCENHSLPFETFSAEELGKVQGDFEESAFVKKTTGVANVCERAAVLGADGGKVIIKKTKGDGVTVAVAVKEETLYVK